MRKAGDVTYADAHKDRRNEGVVEFASRRDMERRLGQVRRLRPQRSEDQVDRGEERGQEVQVKDEEQVALPQIQVQVPQVSVSLEVEEEGLKVEIEVPQPQREEDFKVQVAQS